MVEYHLKILLILCKPQRQQILRQQRILANTKSVHAAMISAGKSWNKPICDLLTTYLLYFRIRYDFTTHVLADQVSASSTDATATADLAKSMS